jgi:hypothetical protein
MRVFQKKNQSTRTINQLVLKDTKWNWSDQCQNAFQLLKESLTRYPILIIPDFRKRFIIHCDASYIALGGVLSQLDENNAESAIEWSSKVLKPNEKNYTMPHLECLSVAYHMIKWSI